MSRRPWFVFAGGGTGGHLFPAMGVIEHLKANKADVDITFYCTTRPIDADILNHGQIDYQPQTVRPIPTRKTGWPMFLWQWQWSIAKCMATFAKRRPAFVLGAGGYASDPPIRAALRMGIPAFLLNPDAVPGQANKRVGHHRGIKGIFAMADITTRHFPADAPLIVTGCPVRTEFREATQIDAAKARTSFDLAPDKPTILVTGASQGARTINEVMMTLGTDVRDAGWQVLHLAGQSDCERVNQAYAQDRVPAVVLTFTNRMPEAMAACDLIISRAGASTLAEILAAGKPSVLLPYPYHKDQHQKHNGQVLVDAGAAMMIDDRKDAGANAGPVGDIVRTLINQPEKCRKMGQNAKNLDRPDAAARIASHLCEASGITL